MDLCLTKSLKFFMNSFIFFIISDIIIISNYQMNLITLRVTIVVGGQFGGGEGLITAITGKFSIPCDLGEEGVEDSFEFSSDIAFCVDVFF